MKLRRMKIKTKNHRNLGIKMRGMKIEDENGGAGVARSSAAAKVGVAGIDVSGALMWSRRQHDWINVSKFIDHFLQPGARNSVAASSKNIALTLAVCHVCSQEIHVEMPY
ncbi:hypothetical protein Tco_0739360 [Tanacetum coccineum]